MTRSRKDWQLLTRRWWQVEAGRCCFDFAMAMLGRLPTTAELNEMFQELNEHMTGVDRRTVAFRKSITR